MSNPLKQLSEWYSAQCNGDWEHQYGIRIDTLDNPGWSVSVELTGTALIGRPFKEVSTERTEADWLRCRVVGDKFEAFGGATNLEEMLRIFVEWASSQR